MPLEGQDKVEKKEEKKAEGVTERVEFEKEILPKFCKYMDDSLLYPEFGILEFFSPFFSFQPLDLNKLWTEQLAAVRQSESKRADETDRHYTARTSIKTSNNMAPFRQEQEKIYADLAGNHCALFLWNNSNYRNMCDVVASMIGINSERVHAYICYRQDQLMQKCCVRDSKISEDYKKRIKPVYDQGNYTEIVYDKAKEWAQKINAVEEARKAQEAPKAQEAKEKEAEQKGIAQEAKEKEEEKRIAQEAKQKEAEQKRVVPVVKAKVAEEDQDEVLAKVEADFEGFINSFPYLKKYTEIPIYTKADTRGNEKLARGRNEASYQKGLELDKEASKALDIFKSDLKEFKQFKDLVRTNSFYYFGKVLAYAGLKHNERMNQLQNLLAQDDKKYQGLAKYKGNAISVETENKQQLLKDAYLQARKEEQAAKRMEAKKKQEEQKRERLRKQAEEKAKKAEEKKKQQIAEPPKPQEAAPVQQVAEPPKPQEAAPVQQVAEPPKPQEAAPVQQVAEPPKPQEAAPVQQVAEPPVQQDPQKQKEAAVSLRAELVRLQGRLAYNSRATGAMKQLRSTVASKLDSLSQDCSLDDVKSVSESILASAHNYLSDKAAMKGGFSSTQLLRLKTINYIKAVEYMSNKVPALGLQGEEGQRFMLAVKTEMAMALYNDDPKKLCDGSIIEQAEKLYQDPSFQTAIVNSGKSIKDLRQTKGLTFAREFLPKIKGKANQKGNAQPENKKVAEKSKAKTDEIKFNK